MKDKQTRFIALQNDALALATANFFFPIIDWKTHSERTQNVSNVISKVAWIVKSMNINQLLGLNPKKANPHYLTIQERLEQLPKGFSPKIDELTCIYQPHDELYFLKWCKDTIHTSLITPDKEYQKWIVSALKEIWNQLNAQYKKHGGTFTLEQYRPSILVLEGIRNTKNKEIELVNDEDFIWQTLLPDLRGKLFQNPVAKAMYHIVYRTQVKRGVWEYHPTEELKA